MAMELLVPIRFDLEVDGKFLKDAFCWNASESDDRVEEFAVGLCKDASLPSTFIPVVVDSMRRQINEFRVVEEKAKARMVHEPERLELIKIKLRSGTTSIEDQIVWDIFSRVSNEDPERFAKGLCEDLALDKASGEGGLGVAHLESLIAHKVREEVFNKKKELFHSIRDSSDSRRGGKKSSSGYGKAPASPYKLSQQQAREQQKLLVSRNGIERPAQDQGDFETRVSQISEEEAARLDKEDEERAVAVRQQEVAKKIEEIQQSKRGKQKQQQQMLANAVAGGPYKMLGMSQMGAADLRSPSPFGTSLAGQLAAHNAHSGAVGAGMLPPPNISKYIGKGKSGASASAAAASGSPLGGIGSIPGVSPTAQLHHQAHAARMQNAFPPHPQMHGLGGLGSVNAAGLSLSAGGLMSQGMHQGMHGHPLSGRMDGGGGAAGARGSLATTSMGAAMPQMMPPQQHLPHVHGQASQQSFAYGALQSPLDPIPTAATHKQQHLGAHAGHAHAAMVAAHGQPMAQAQQVGAAAAFYGQPQAAGGMATGHPGMPPPGMSAQMSQLMGAGGQHQQPGGYQPAAHQRHTPQSMHHQQAPHPQMMYHQTPQMHQQANPGVAYAAAPGHQYQTQQPQATAAYGMYGVPQQQQQQQQHQYYW